MYNTLSIRVSLLVAALVTLLVHPTSAQQSCSSVCAAGEGQVPRPTAAPQANGCGPRFADLYKITPQADFRPCCDQHDLCFSSCNSTLEYCNRAFYACMQGQCRSKSGTAQKECDALATCYAKAVTGTWACDIYQQSQRGYCGCSAAVPPASPELSGLPSIPGGDDAFNPACLLHTSAAGPRAVESLAVMGAAVAAAAMVSILP